MDAAKRSRYLAALGIERWVPRASVFAEERGVATAEAAAAIAETAVPEAPAAPFSPAVAADAMGSIPSTSVVDPAATADWAALEALVAGCKRCKLCETRTQTVFGVGSQNAPLLIVGEGPGADEDAQGKPFVGAAGKLLDEMLRAIGRSRRSDAPEAAVYIANVVKCRPPGNRDPQPEEAAACRPFLDRQIALLQPKLIVAAGRIAAQRLLDSTATLGALRGAAHHYGPTKIPVFVTYHPAYLLRSPAEKAKSWLDLKRIYRLLAQGPSDGASSAAK